jgi:methylthioribose-1-phosphate isomerase
MPDRNKQMLSCAAGFRTIWLERPGLVRTIDQRRLPHDYVVADLTAWQHGHEAIADMLVRGAPLIGATAAWSLYLAARLGRSEFDRATRDLAQARPTAVNLRWAVNRVTRCAADLVGDDLVNRVREEAESICTEDIDISRRIGRHGLALIREIADARGGEPVNVLTHCNAGALATINYGTATAPLYLAHKEGIPIHVWVSETRPRNQWSQLTAYELAHNGVPHTLVVDNACGHLMQHGRVDLVITGTDRTTRRGDVANKIGTYLKAVAARDNGIPFYVALPSTTIDWQLDDGLGTIPIEERHPEEVTHVYGMQDGQGASVRTVGSETPAANYAFDVTPARLVTGLITERGICAANRAGLEALFPEQATEQVPASPTVTGA